MDLQDLQTKIYNAKAIFLEDFLIISKLFKPAILKSNSSFKPDCFLAAFGEIPKLKSCS